MRYKLSKHARENMQSREVPADVVDKVFYYPEQILDGEDGTKIYQSRFNLSVTGRAPKLFLVRLVVADDADPVVIITLYLTSQISKYWSPL